MTSDHIAVRMASEDIALAAIARVLKRPFSDISSVIDGAIDDGYITRRPPAEWPRDFKGQRIVGPVDEAANSQKIDRADLDRLIAAGCLTFRLTRSEATTLGVILLRNVVTRTALHYAVTPEAEPKIIDVFICKLRRKLAPYQLQIITVWGVGYQIPPASKASILARYRAEGLL
jgi:hypothetical protein